MDFDQFFATPRWKILEIISKRPSSPIEISAELKTSVAYVSQQLKLLEAISLIKKEKTGSSEKGKPRTLFSPSKELCYLTLLTKENSEKKLISLTAHQKAILSIWFLKNVETQIQIEKIFNFLEDDLSEIKGILIEETLNKERIIVVSDSKKIKSKIENILKNFKLDIIQIPSQNFIKHISPSMKAIYTDHEISDFIKMKGGTTK